MIRKKRKRARIIRRSLMLALGIILFLLLAVYLYFGFYFQTHFFYQTQLEEIEVGGMTAQEKCIWQNGHF